MDLLQISTVWPIFGRQNGIFLGQGQTVNLLALRLQWFESTPAQASPRAILEVFKPFGGDTFT